MVCESERGYLTRSYLAEALWRQFWPNSNNMSARMSPKSVHDERYLSLWQANNKLLLLLLLARLPGFP